MLKMKLFTPEQVKIFSDNVKQHEETLKLNF